MSRSRILLADDHRVVIEGLRRLLESEFELVGLVEDGRALVTAARTLQPDVVVADITMPHLNGIEAMLQVKKELPKVKFVFLTMHQDAAYARRAFETGASGYVVKHSAPGELVLAIQAALKGQTFITPALTGDVLRPPRAGDANARITQRQRVILRLLAEGRSAKEIASELAISPRTVEFHKYQIMETHGIRSSAELVHFAIKHGIVSI